jgi:hypothetical protein
VGANRYVKLNEKMKLLWDAEMRVNTVNDLVFSPCNAWCKWRLIQSQFHFLRFMFWMCAAHCGTCRPKAAVEKCTISQTRTTRVWIYT